MCIRYKSSYINILNSYNNSIYIDFQSPPHLPLFIPIETDNDL